MQSGATGPVATSLLIPLWRPRAYRDKLWDLWGFSFVVLFLQIVTLVASFRVPELNEMVTLNLNEGHGSSGNRKAESHRGVRRRGGA